MQGPAEFVSSWKLTVEQRLRKRQGGVCECSEGDTSARWQCARRVEWPRNVSETSATVCNGCVIFTSQKPVVFYFVGIIELYCQGALGVSSLSELPDSLKECVEGLSLVCGEAAAQSREKEALISQPSSVHGSYAGRPRIGSMAKLRPWKGERAESSDLLIPAVFRWRILTGPWQAFTGWTQAETT